MDLKFTIIIATCNRSESLKDTLESLIKQDYDWQPVTEIIIVDNNSTDGTEKLICSYKDSFKTELKYLKEIKQGKSHALNLAIAASQNDVLVFTDDDVILDPKWLAEIVRFFKENDPDILGGRVVSLYPPQTPQWIKKNKHYLRGPIVFYDHGEDAIDYNSGKIPSFIGANVAYKRNLFKKTGLFNTDLGPGRGTFGDDTDMFERAAKISKKVFYNGKALVWHKTDPKRMTLGYIAKWNFQHGKSMALLEFIKGKQQLVCVGGVPFYLLRGIALKLIKLSLSVFQPNLFLKHWCSFYFNLGMIAGYKKRLK